VADQPTITIELTKEQQLEILAATGLRVKTLELPVEALTDGEEALARLPIPEWLRKAAWFCSLAPGARLATPD
jgi:hypothetical protein